MCLNSLWEKPRIENLKKQEKRDGFIRAWKVVRYRSSLKPLVGPTYSNEPYKTKYAVNHSKGGNNRKPPYQIAFHAYATKRAANAHIDRDGSYNIRVIPCLLQDIVAAGKQNNRIVYVAKKMILLTEH